MTEVTLKDARNLAEVIEASRVHGEPTTITRYGRPYAVVIDIATWRRIQSEEAADYDDYAQFLRDEGVGAEVDQFNRQVAAGSAA